jgi:hypothetical protein
MVHTASSACVHALFHMGVCACMWSAHVSVFVFVSLVGGVGMTLGAIWDDAGYYPTCHLPPSLRYVGHTSRVLSCAWSHAPVSGVDGMLKQRKGPPGGARGGSAGKAPSASHVLLTGMW